MDDGIGLAKKMLGLPGLRVLEVEEGVGEVVIRVESTCTKAVCPSCRSLAQAQDRVEVHLRDVNCFRRPSRLVLVKRRWRCRRPACAQGLDRTGRRCGVRWVGCAGRASVADEYGVAWDTAWAAVVFHGSHWWTISVRVRGVRALGVDEHSFLVATREHWPDPVR